MGRYPDLSLADARKQAKQLLANNALEEGAFVPEGPIISFAQAREDFLADCERRNKPRTVADYRRLLHKHFTFKGDVREVSRAQIMKVISKLSDTPSEKPHAYVAIYPA
ncbi:Arm DNA-binding domain-containing protein [Octadecabacter ascidiaceicola]|uniref:Arm DNA-binding domain-containing protein n=1 Tax=Octadecabacter ascidiaceicola TaxID=1655543 RepID=UPI0015C6523F|nr:Arm DNA-binding domain-containing protein [Octadecabacter ascidiaceicola]